MAALTKASIAASLSENFGFTINDSKKIVDIFFTEIAGAIERGEQVKIEKFGTFKILHKRARMARNPRTGAPAVVSPRRVASFKAAPDFKRACGGDV